MGSSRVSGDLQSNLGENRKIWYDGGILSSKLYPLKSGAKKTKLIKKVTWIDFRRILTPRIDRIPFWDSFW